MPLSDDQLRAIGRISVLFNELEYSTNVIVGALVNSDPNIGRIAFEGESFYRMLDKASKLSGAIFRIGAEQRSQIERWASRADSVRKRRNDVLHALWAIDQPTGEMVAWHPTRFLPFPKSPDMQMRAQDLDRFAAEVASVLQEANEIVRAVLRSSPPENEPPT